MHQAAALDQFVSWCAHLDVDDELLLNEETKDGNEMSGLWEQHSSNGSRNAIRANSTTPAAGGNIGKAMSSLEQILEKCSGAKL